MNVTSIYNLNDVFDFLHRTIKDTYGTSYDEYFKEFKINPITRHVVPSANDFGKIVKSLMLDKTSMDTIFAIFMESVKTERKKEEYRKIYQDLKNDLSKSDSDNTSSTNNTTDETAEQEEHEFVPAPTDSEEYKEIEKVSTAEPETAIEETVDKMVQQYKKEDTAVEVLPPVSPIPPEMTDYRKQFGALFAETCFMHGIVISDVMTFFDLSEKEVRDMIGGKIDPPKYLALKQFVNTHKIGYNTFEQLVELAQKGRRDTHIELPQTTYDYLNRHPLAIDAIIAASRENLDDEYWGDLMRNC